MRVKNLKFYRSGRKGNGERIVPKEGGIKENFMNFCFFFSTFGSNHYLKLLMLKKEIFLFCDS